MFGRILLCSSLALGFICQVQGACVNNDSKHQKAIVVTPGEAPRYDYRCDVRRSEDQNFKDGYCKKCGCHLYDHDDEMPQQSTTKAAIK